MKKKMTALLTAFLCMSMSVVPVSGSADSLVMDSFSTDTFTYTDKNFCFELKSEIASPDFMVIGCNYNPKNPDEMINYIVVPINNISSGNGVGEISVKTITKTLGEDVQLRAGDLLQISGSWITVEKVPPLYKPDAYDEEMGPGNLELLGNGADVFGEEFKRVICMQMVQAYYGSAVAQGKLDLKLIKDDITLDDAMDVLALVKGDANSDEALDVLDCITINRHLLAGTELCEYAKLAGDINANGRVDYDDSLAIMKEVVEITVDFQ